MLYPFLLIQALQFLQALKSERNGKPQTETLDAPVSSGHFFMKSLAEDPLEKESEEEDTSEPCMHR